MPKYTTTESLIADIPKLTREVISYLRTFLGEDSIDWFNLKILYSDSNVNPEYIFSVRSNAEGYILDGDWGDGSIPSSMMEVEVESLNGLAEYLREGFERALLEAAEGGKICQLIVRRNEIVAWTASGYEEIDDE